MTFVTKKHALPTIKNSVGALIYNETGRIIMSDPYFDHAFNFNEGESIGMQIQELIPCLYQKNEIEYDNDELPNVPRTLPAINKQGDVFRLEVIINRFNTGVEFNTLLRLTDITQQSPITIDTISNDLQLQIQKRKITEEKLIKIQRTYDAMVHNFPDGVIGILNQEMKYVLIDGKDLSDIDLPAMGLTKKANHEKQNVESATETLIYLKKAFKGEHVSFDIATKDQVYNIIAVPLPDLKNNIPEILCVLRNVTERKRMEDGLRVALEKEKELSDLKSRFVTMASHEFRTPLSTILSSAYLLEKYTGTDFDKEKKVHIRRIQRGVGNLTAILNEFLSIEKYDQNDVKLSPTTIDVVSLMKNIAFEMDFVKKEKQIISFTHIGNSVALALDYKLLWTIITNLITNAIKYSSDSASVSINSEISNTLFNLTISDNGIGIPEDEQPHIFERFYRARNATNYEGTGLGLHIVQKWVHLLKGTISFESHLNIGTTFFISIPSKTE